MLIMHKGKQKELNCSAMNSPESRIEKRNYKYLGILKMNSKSKGIK